MQPFRPFRIHLSDGSTHEVPHPEFALLTKWAVHVAKDTDEDEIGDQVTRLAIGQITRIEDLEAQPA